MERITSEAARAPSVGEALREFFVALGQLVFDQQGLALPAFLVLIWIVWWLCGVRWERAWPFLRQGAWAPLVVLSVAIALVWSQIAPSTCWCLGLFGVPNFWWQLGGVGLLFALALFCGWLQGVLNWEPAELNLEPPAHHDADHGHGPDDGRMPATENGAGHP